MEPSRTLEPRTTYLALLLLAEGPKTGYELLKRLRSMIPEMGRGASPGTLYPLLRSLEEEGYVASVEESSGGRRRKVYRITEKGVEKLIQMALHGLEVIEALLKLHIRAFERLSSEGRMPEAMARLFLEKLRSVERLTREFSERLARVEAWAGAGSLSATGLARS